MENIMACMTSKSPGEQLITRSIHLTQLFKAKLVILYLSKEGEMERQEKQKVQRLIEKDGGQIVFQTYTDDAHKIAIILEKAQKYHVTQLLITQYSQTRWDIIKKGDFINRLLKKVGEIDLHVISLEK